MDPFDVVNVRFHIGGRLDYDGNSLNYIGGGVELSHIEKDNLYLS